MSLFALSARGCGGLRGSAEGLDDDQVSELSLETLRHHIQPYDLSGGTARGLALLDAWMASNPEQVDAGRRLRHATLLDLWVFAGVSAGIDDWASEQALSIAAEALAVPPSGPSPGPLRERVGAALVAELEADVSNGHASAVEGDSVALARIDATAGNAAQAFATWEAGAPSPRARLLLSGILYRTARNGPSAPGSLLRPFPWLCDAPASADPAELARACGFWCADLPERPMTSPRIERQAHELSEDDTPVDWDDVYSEAASAERSPADEASGRSMQDDPVWVPTPGDVGYDLVQACGADYFRLPRVGGLVLLDERNFLDLVYLSFVAGLLSDLERDLLRGEPLTVLASGVLAEHADFYLRGAFPQALTPAALNYDVRMELPRGLTGSSPEPVEPALRLVVVRSDGLSLALSPHLQLTRLDGSYELVYAESDRGYHYPGGLILPFERVNRIDPVQVEADRIPQLRAALADLEVAASALEGASESAPGPCGNPQGQPISVLADGSTYFSTLRPILGTLVDCGYTIWLHTWLPSAGGLDQLPLRVVPEPEAGRQRLAVDIGGYTLSAAGGDGEPFRVDTSEQAPLTALYRHLAAGIGDGTVDPTKPLAITIEDERVDWGMLVHVVQAVAYPRTIPAPESDAELLAAPRALEGGDGSGDGSGDPWIGLPLLLELVGETAE